MPQPTEGEVLQRAKELAHHDGKLWGHPDLETGSLDPREPGADDSDEAEYLSRARDMLPQGV
jgi:hypothetical protein